LKYCSFLSVIAVFAFTLVIIVSTALNGSPTAEVIEPQGSGFGIIASIPNLFVAYVFHYNVFPLYMALEDRTNRNILKSVFIGISMAGIFYLIIGNFGYLAYGNGLDQSILSSLTKGEEAIRIISEVSLAVLVFNSYPLLFMEYKKNVVKLVQDIRGGNRPIAGLMKSSVNANEFDEAVGAEDDAP